MTNKSGYTVKIADNEIEFDLIHRLNYKTFVEEIPQHEINESGYLVDKFHNENTYIISLDGNKLAGMVAVRGNRPFSLDSKIPDLNSYLPENKNICELRLLTVEKEYRRGYAFYDIARNLVSYCRENNYDYAIISGTTRQQKLYKHIGFAPFYHLVGKEGAFYQPMYINVEKLEMGLGKLLKRIEAGEKERQIVNLLPGPVEIHPEVKREFGKPAVSHRGESFINDFNIAKSLLCKYVNASKVEIFTGSGTLANEAVAAQLSDIKGKGLILACGEFGERLVKIAGRHGLDFKLFKKQWGEVFTRKEIAGFLDNELPDCSWLWTVHCETSTGALNDLSMLEEVSSERGIKLCLDCISSIGTIPLDLSNIYLASGTSGKAVGGYAGLALVFYNHDIKPSENIPLYFDIGYYSSKNGIPFTIPTNSVYALKKAIELLSREDKFTKIKEVSSFLRQELLSLGLNVIIPEQYSSPAVITFALPLGLCSKKFGQIMGEKGYLLSFNSYYLIEKNWAQACIMGEINIDYIEGFRESLMEALAPREHF
ncbi:MAG: hypothetical protein JM58_19125 [Peptococcaceae bacterium BICA1-8]|nr:MAG: hypothetical protein JM58_19125 [Peptococcaceae bacterium BICA1-8]